MSLRASRRARWPWTSWCRTMMCSVAATQVTASNEDEGFARAIEDFILSAGAGGAAGLWDQQHRRRRRPPGCASAEVVARLHVLDPAGMGRLPAQHLAGLV